MTARARLRLLALALPVALASAGCGAGRSGASFPAELGSRLARESDLVAAKLGQGDECAAGRAASALQASAERAITAGQVPAPLRAGLRERTQALAASIVCAPPPQPQPPGAASGGDHGDHGDGGDHADGEGDGGGD